jgi:hypothetical protein
VNLAKDFHTVCDTDFPATQIAEFVTKQNSMAPTILNNRVQGIDFAM